MEIGLVTLVVADYDEAIAFYVDKVGFELVEDSPATTNDGRPKRWVVVRPRGAATGLLLAEAADERSQAVDAAPMREIDGLFEHFAAVARQVGFARDDTFAAVELDLRRLAARAGLTSREIQLLRGLLRRTQHRLEPPSAG